jgi:hypothetical protein
VRPEQSLKVGCFGDLETWPLCLKRPFNPGLLISWHPLGNRRSRKNSRVFLKTVGKEGIFGVPAECRLT